MKVIISGATLGTMKLLMLSKWTDKEDSSIILGTKFHVILIDSEFPENTFEKFSVKIPWDYDACKKMGWKKRHLLALKNLEELDTYQAAQRYHGKLQAQRFTRRNKK